MDIKLQIEKRIPEGYALITVDCGIIEPSFLKTFRPPEIVNEGLAGLGIIIRGRIPLWLMAYFTHEFHATPFFAVYDPRYQGAIVVSSHSKNQSVGTIIPLLFE